MNIIKCKHCNSENVRKNGFRINVKTNESTRRIFCKDCKKCCSSTYNERYSDELKEEDCIDFFKKISMEYSFCHSFSDKNAVYQSVFGNTFHS